MSYRIYVACLASYNSGRLHGAWVDLQDGAESAHAEIAAMLRASPYPNVTVDCPDCDGNGCNLNAVSCSTCAATGRVPSAEEWAIHDYDDEYGALSDMFGEHGDIEALCELAEALDEKGEALAAFIACRGGNYWAAPDAAQIVREFEECYYGEADTEADFAAQLLEDTGALESMPENLRGYFDYEAYARDLKHDGFDFERYNGTLYVFSDR